MYQDVITLMFSLAFMCMLHTLKFTYAYIYIYKLL